MKLIDAEDVLRDKVWFCGGFVSDDFSMGYMEALDKVETVIRNAPTVDAVPVVRCKDCVRFVENKSAFVTYCSKGNGMAWVRPDDFCSHAERRTTND